jgi:hypothetical protein
MTDTFSTPNVQIDGTLCFECVGEKMSFKDKLITTSGGRQHRFLIRTEANRDIPSHYGIFFSKALCGRDFQRYPRQRRIAVLSETPNDPSHERLDSITQQFEIIYTHQQHLYEKGPPFRRLLLGTNWLVGEELGQLSHITASSKSDLVCFVGSIEHSLTGAYAFRNDVYQYLAKETSVPCYGKGIAPFESKRGVLEPFRFAIVMENASSNYYFTEKLVDCLLLRTIPIYYGCPDIHHVFDPRGLLQFKTLAELRTILASVSDGLYDSMLPYAEYNRQLLLDNDWFSHEGLLRRICEQLTLPDSCSVAVPSGVSMMVDRAIRRLRNFVRRKLPGKNP